MHDDHRPTTSQVTTVDGQFGTHRVTIRCTWPAWDSNRISAANTARSAQDSCGLLTWRRSTATSWRSTRISAFFDRELPASNPSQAMSSRKIRYSNHSATAGDHA